MPVYNIASRTALSQPMRKKVADVITDTHCGLTGAPPEFVNVIFMHGHPLKNGDEINIVCNVRSGGNRNAELTENLRLKIEDGVSLCTGTRRENVSATLLGFPASWAMEGGEILPEPGAEASWLARAKERG